MKDEQFYFLRPTFCFPSTFPELKKVSGDFINSCLTFIIPKKKWKTASCGEMSVVLLNKRM